jgi:hypothetical protein
VEWEGDNRVWPNSWAKPSRIQRYNCSCVPRLSSRAAPPGAELVDDGHILGVCILQDLCVPAVSHSTEVRGPGSQDVRLTRSLELRERLGDQFAGHAKRLPPLHALGKLRHHALMLELEAGDVGRFLECLATETRVVVGAHGFVVGFLETRLFLGGLGVFSLPFAQAPGGQVVAKVRRFVAAPQARDDPPLDVDLPLLEARSRSGGGALLSELLFARRVHLLQEAGKLCLGRFQQLVAV